VAKLMKDFNTLFKEGKYVEAESLAMRAHELDPDNGVATAAVFMAQRGRHKNEYDTIKENRAEATLEGLNSAEYAGAATPAALKNGLGIDPERLEIARKRPNLSTYTTPRRSEKERDIERRLNSPVTLNFTNAPLRQVIEDLRAWQGMNIYIDMPALD